MVSNINPLNTSNNIFEFADINECLVNNGGCSDICTNTFGNFTCSCMTGYALTDDGRTCTGMYM